MFSYQGNVIQTNVYAVSEYGEVLYPGEPRKYGLDVGEESAEEHHEDVGEGDEHVGHREQLDGGGNEEGDGTGADRCTEQG